MKPGLYAMTRDEYDALDALNHSKLSKFLKSPAHFKHWEKHDTEAMQRGRCVDMALFEPHRFATQCVVYPGPVRRGKAWEEFEAAHVGAEIVTADERDHAQAIADAVRLHPIGSKYFTGGSAQQAVVWEEDGILCKALLDYLGPLGIADLKTTDDASVTGFPRKAAKYGMHRQMAWYRRGVAAVTGEVLPCALVAVEADRPWPVTVFHLDETSLNGGEETCLAWLNLYRTCVAANSWPAYADEVVDLVVPEWGL